MVNDFNGNPLCVGDDVIFTYYMGNGMLHKGKILNITQKTIIVQGYFRRFDGTFVPYEVGRRRIEINGSKNYLIKIE
jgi:hypothetical protein